MFVSLSLRVVVCTVVVLFLFHLVTHLKFTCCFVFIVPGPVISPVAFSFGMDWISLRWEPPYPPHGELEKYKIEYRLLSPYNYMSKEITYDAVQECTLWKGKICFSLTASDGIVGNKDYSISVSDTAAVSSD